jgi:hypothetical protein
MAEETTTDGASNTTFIEEEVVESPPGDTQLGDAPPPTPPVEDPAPQDTPSPDDVSEVKLVPEPDAPTGDATSPKNPDEPVKSDPGAEVPLDDFTESGASPEPETEFDEPPSAPEVVDSSAEGVAGGATNEDGSQEFLLDTDGDGLFDTSAVGVPIGDGQFKIVESSPLEEPIPDPRGASPEPDAGTGTPEITDDNADEAEVELPRRGDFIDPDEVDVVETRPGLFEADLDGDGTNDVEFRGRVGDDGLIEVGRARPIEGDGPAGINEDNAPPLIEVDPENPDGEPKLLEPDADDDGVEVVEIPGGDAVDPGGPPNIFPPDPKGEGEAPPPGGLDENGEIQPDKEPDPIDRLRPDRESPPPEDEAPVAPPAGEVAPEAPAGEVAPEDPAHEPPAAGHEPPADVGVDLPELHEAPPPYASGSDGDGRVPPSGDGETSTTTVDDPGVGVPEVPAADYEPETDDPADEPLEVNAAEGEGDEAGLLEQVADAVGDLWDDAKDVVT